MKNKSVCLLLIATLLIVACAVDVDMAEPTIEYPEFNPTPYEIVVPDDYPLAPNPADNPTTVEGIDLGRKLFYDPILSIDNSMACASCHLQENAFAEPLDVSFGVNNQKGTRNAMNLFNLAYMNQLTWGGSASSLEEQALEPVPNPIELDLPWDEAIEKLEESELYPPLFHSAFGETEITPELTTKAIAQFLRTIVSFSSKYDMILQGGFGVQFTDLEFDGRDIFFNENGIPGEAECIHCHGGSLFTDNMFHNNGLDEVASAADFTDIGLGATTMVLSDYGKFKTPTLRNIELTAPYMHDGRFATLEEVIDHYSTGVKNSPSLDPLIASPHTNLITLNFSEHEKNALVAFLKTLTDTVLINNEAYSNPF